MRKIAGTLLAVAIAAAGVVGLIAFFNARDNSTTDAQPATGKTAPAVAPPPAGGLIEKGNVVLQFSDASFRAKLQTLADSLGAPDTPETRAAGQAVILQRNPKTGGVAASSAQAALTVPDPSDPRLQDFIERRLGQGVSG